jgi:DNA-binding CsgD family transcriptional regulator
MRIFINEILDSATAPDGWDGVLDSFNTTFGISSSCMFTLHESRNSRLNYTCGHKLRKHLTPDDRDLMERGGEDADKTTYLALSQRESQKFYEERALFGVARPEDLPPSKGRDLTAEMGLNTRTCAALNKTGPWLDGLFGQHPNADEAAALLSEPRMDIILPIMAHSLTLGRTLSALKSKFNASLSVLDALGIGVFLVSATGEIMEHNQEAKDILAQNDGLGMTRSKRFYLNKYEETAELDRMITDANKLLDGEVTSLNSLLNVSRPSGSFDFLLSVHALSDSQAELENGFKCAFVTVIDPARKNVLTADGIAALCDLTFSETEVVKLVIQGIRPAEVAARRSVSVNTVKTQIKSILHKTRCSNQSDIIRAAAATRIPIKSGAGHSFV